MNSKNNHNNRAQNAVKRPKTATSYPIYVALDACIIINICRFILNKERPKNRLDKEHVKYLQELYKNSVMGEFGKRNKNGKFVICLLPSVKEEIKKKMKEHPEEYERLWNGKINNILLPLNIDYTTNHGNNGNRFIRMTNEMAHQYCKLGCFKSPKSHWDALHTAQASYFNIQLISRDKHIVGKMAKTENDENFEAKQENIRNVNNNFLSERVFSMLPQTIDRFFKNLEQGVHMPKLQNRDALDKYTMAKLQTINSTPFQQKSDGRDKN